MLHLMNDFIWSFCPHLQLERSVKFCKHILFALSALSVPQTRSAQQHKFCLHHYPLHCIMYQFLVRKEQSKMVCAFGWWVQGTERRCDVVQV